MAWRYRHSMRRGGDLWREGAPPERKARPSGGVPMIERSPTAFEFAWVPFQCLTIPLRELCPTLVGTLEEFQEDLFRCVCAPHILVPHEEQAPVCTVPGR